MLPPRLSSHKHCLKAFELGSEPYAATDCEASAEHVGLYVPPCVSTEHNQLPERALCLAGLHHRSIKERKSKLIFKAYFNILPVSRYQR